MVLHFYFVVESTIQHDQCLDFSSSKDETFHGFTESDFISAPEENVLSEKTHTSTQSMSPVFKVPSHISVLQQNASKSIQSCLYKEIQTSKITHLTCQFQMKERDKKKSLKNLNWVNLMTQHKGNVPFANITKLTAISLHAQGGAL